MAGVSALMGGTLLIGVMVYGLLRFLLFYIDVHRRARHIMRFPGIEPMPILGHAGMVGNLTGLETYAQQAQDVEPKFSSILGHRLRH